MSARVPTGARPGARFAQFKLVLLGSSSCASSVSVGHAILTSEVGESAVGKVLLSLRHDAFQHPTDLLFP